MTKRPSSPPPAQTAAVTAGGQLVLTPRLDQFRRLYRWFNLTMIHQALWPLLVVLAAAPQGDPEEIPGWWYAARIAGPLIAAVAALLYVRQPPPGGGENDAEALVGRPQGVLAQQAKLLLIGLPAMLLLARVVVGPTEPVLKLALFGLLDVAAFQLIHFGVVRRSYPHKGDGIGMAIALFGVSWGLRDLLMTALLPDSASPVLALAAGVLLGVVVAAVSRVLYRWPGGLLVAGALQWTLFTLVFGFV